MKSETCCLCRRHIHGDDCDNPKHLSTDCFFLCCTCYNDLKNKNSTREFRTKAFDVIMNSVPKDRSVVLYYSGVECSKCYSYTLQCPHCLGNAFIPDIVDNLSEYFFRKPALQNEIDYGYLENYIIEATFVSIMHQTFQASMNMQIASSYLDGFNKSSEMILNKDYIKIQKIIGDLVHSILDINTYEELSIQYPLQVKEIVRNAYNKKYKEEKYYHA